MSAAKKPAKKRAKKSSKKPADKDAAAAVIPFRAVHEQLGMNRTICIRARASGELAARENARASIDIPELRRWLELKKKRGSKDAPAALKKLAAYEARQGEAKPAAAAEDEFQGEQTGSGLFDDQVLDSMSRMKISPVAIDNAQKLALISKAASSRAILDERMLKTWQEAGRLVDVREVTQALQRALQGLVGRVNKLPNSMSGSVAARLGVSADDASAALGLVREQVLDWLRECAEQVEPKMREAQETGARKIRQRAVKKPRP